MDPPPEAASAAGSSTSPLPVLLLAGAALTALGLIALLIVRYFSSRSTTNINDLFSVDSYAIEFPPECDAYDELKERDGVEPWELKKALMKRAVAGIPVRNYMQEEEQKIRRLYKKTMVSTATWQSFQDALASVIEEIEYVTAEAEELEEGWGQQVWHQAAFFYRHFITMRKRAQDSAAREKQLRNKAKKAQEDKKKQAQNLKRQEEERVQQAERAAQELLAMEEKKHKAAAGGGGGGGGGAGAGGAGSGGGAGGASGLHQRKSSKNKSKGGKK